MVPQRICNTAIQYVSRVEKTKNLSRHTTLFLELGWNHMYMKRS